MDREEPDEQALSGPGGGPEAEAKARAELLGGLLSDKPDDPSAVLGPIAALREVVAICESIAWGRGSPGAGDRRSLQADVQHALTGLGRQMRRELQPAWGDFFHGELNELPGLLDDAGGVSSLRAAAVNLIARLRRPATTQAVWRDLWKTDGSIPIDTLKHWVAVLREVDESLGHEWRWRVGRLRSADGSPEEAEELLSMPPGGDPAVAWFVFADADLVSDYVRKGQIQFFSGRLWPDAITDRKFFASRPDFDFPAELDSEAIDTWFGVTANSEALVYARVELSGPRAEPARTPRAHGRPAEAWARELVTGVVEVGSFRIGGSNWRLLEGGVVFHRFDDGRGDWSGTAGFQDPRIREEIDRFQNPLTERTGDALEELDPRMPDLIAEGDRKALDAVEEARWYEAARNQADPAQRLVLHVRAFERALPVRTRFHWDEAVDYYLREFLILENLSDELFVLAHSSYRDLRGSHPKELEGLEQWLITEQRGGFTVTLGSFLRSADAVLNLTPKSLRLRRRSLKQVAGWAANPGRALDRTTEWSDRFRRLLARTLRQRNATVHGVRTVPEVVASVDEFVAQIAASVVAQTIQSASDREPFVDALERGRARSRRTLWRLEERDGSTDKILYSPEDQN